VIEERTVANDNTIAWERRRLQLPESRLRPHFVKAWCGFHEYPDGTVSVFLAAPIGEVYRHGQQSVPER